MSCQSRIGSVEADEVDLSIIIVNWNSLHHLQKCLKSMDENLPGVHFEVLVIDNASFDGSIPWLESAYPAVVAIQGEKNQGFARANNECFLRSRGRILLFLNPDTEVVGPALETLYRALTDDPATGIAGPKLLNSDGTIQTSCIQRFPTILNQVLDSEWLRGKLPGSSLWGTAPLQSESAHPVPVDVVSGACLMVRRNAFVAAGGFDEGYFMYSEDTDLCYEVHSRGNKNVFVPGAVVVHHGGCSSSQVTSHFSSVMVRESLLRFMRVRYGRTYAMAFRAALGFSAIVRLFLVSLSIIMGGGARETRIVTLDRWKKLLAWVLGSRSELRSMPTLIDARVSVISTELK